MPQVSIANHDQKEFWNDIKGKLWVEMQERIDSMLSPFGEKALRTLNPQKGEKVLEIGSEKIIFDLIGLPGDDFPAFEKPDLTGQDFITINISEKEFVFQAYLTVDGRDFGKTTYTITRPTNKIKITSVIKDNEGPWLDGFCMESSTLLKKF